MMEIWGKMRKVELFPTYDCEAGCASFSKPGNWFQTMGVDGSNFGENFEYLNNLLGWYCLSKIELQILLSKWWGHAHTYYSHVHANDWTSGYTSSEIWVHIFYNSAKLLKICQNSLFWSHFLPLSMYKLKFWGPFCKKDTYDVMTPTSATPGLNQAMVYSLLYV